MPTDRELEVLRAAWEHQLHSAGEPMYFAGLGVHIRMSEDVDNDLEGELVEVLASLERAGLVEKVGETRDGARFPLYQVTAAGARLAEA